MISDPIANPIHSKTDPASSLSGSEVLMMLTTDARPKHAALSFTVVGHGESGDPTEADGGL